MNRAEQAAREAVDRVRQAIPDRPESSSAELSDTSLNPPSVRSPESGGLSESGKQPLLLAKPSRYLRPPGTSADHSGLTFLKRNRKDKNSQNVDEGAKEGVNEWINEEENEAIGASEPVSEVRGGEGVRGVGGVGGVRGDRGGIGGIGGCEECGRCVAACPAHAIELNVYAQANGTDADAIVGPYIDARRQPCVLCEGLLCTHVCPSGALTPLTDPAQVKLGMAVVNQSTCRRADGDDCRKCIDPCPMGKNAIGLDGDGRIVVRRGCTGCGICEQACPNEPASIFIIPA